MLSIQPSFFAVVGQLAWEIDRVKFVYCLTGQVHLYLTRVERIVAIDWMILNLERELKLPF
jgi:hypothetical protein